MIKVWEHCTNKKEKQYFCLKEQGERDPKILGPMNYGTHEVSTKNPEAKVWSFPYSILRAEKKLYVERLKKFLSIVKRGADTKSWA